MAAEVLINNSSGTPVYTTVFFSCPVPNRFSSLAMLAHKAGVNVTLHFRLPQSPFAFTWAKYNQKHKGIFTSDNQVQCYPRSNNVITFSNTNGPGFKDQTAAPVDELNIKVDKNVQSYYYYGGLCLGNMPIYAQLMQPGDMQRYPVQMNLMFGYSYQPIEQGQIIDPAAIKIVNLQEYQGSYRVMINLDRDGQVRVSTQVAAEAETSNA